MSATGVAAAGLLLGVTAGSARLQAAAPALRLPELQGTQLAACPLCRRDIAIAEANAAVGLHARYPGKHGRWRPAHFRVCGRCRGELDPAGRQRALRGWVASELRRLQAEEREGRVPPGGFEELGQRIRRAQLVDLASAEPDP